MFPRADVVAFGLVALGGALGVLARAILILPWAGTETVPWVTLVINAGGSFLLGILVATVGRRRERLRAFFGTGLLGGFTTYSALAVQTAEWLTTAPWLAGALIVGSLTTGILGAFAGLFVGHRIAGTSTRIELAEDAK